MVDNIQDFFAGTENVGIKLLITVAVVLLFVALRRSARYLVRKITHEEMSVIRWTHVATALFGFLAVVVVLVVWFNVTGAIVISAVIVIAIVFLAMKDLVNDLFAFFYITSQAPFEAGDRVEVGEVRGIVHAIGPLHTQVQEIEGWLSTATPTGRIVSIPNSEILSGTFAVTRDEFPFVWIEIALPIAHEHNLEKAEKILTQAGECEVARLINAQNSDKDEEAPDAEILTRETLEERASVYCTESATPTITLDMDGQGITVTMRFLAHQNDIGGAKTRVWRDVYHRLAGVDDVALVPDTLEVDLGKQD